MHGITRKEAKMGTRNIIFFLTVSFLFYSPASLFPLGKNLPPSVHLQENVVDKEELDEHSSSNNGGGNGIAHHSNFAHGGGGTEPGGQSGGNGEEGNGGGSKSPNTAGGAAVIPLYGAGAANNRHNYHHHGAGSSNQSGIGLGTLCAVILASLVVHIYEVTLLFED